MTEPKRSEFPTLSADPNKQIADQGSPLYRFQFPTRYINLFQEDQVISRTNSFKPTQHTVKEQRKPIVRQMTKELALYDVSESKAVDELVSQDIDMNREYEQYDPLKGNSLVVTDYLDEFELFLFSAGPSLSHLVIATSRIQPYETNDYKIDLPLDQLTIKDTTDLLYPIKQIALSPKSNIHRKIFLVRTTSSIHLYSLKAGQLTLINELLLHKESETNPDINYSMPAHVEPSPHSENEYLFVTTNGYIALMDGKTNKILYKCMEPIPDHLNYKSRWKSCGFSSTPWSIYIASPESVKELTFRSKLVERRLLASPNDRIVAFKSSRNSLYAIVTLDTIFIMDRRVKDRSIVTWPHRMRGLPPTEILIDELPDHNWRITACSQFTQKYAMMHFQYIYDPKLTTTPTARIYDIYNLELEPLKFEEIYNYTSRIGSVGCSIRTADKELILGNNFYSIYRLFEDGSMRVQYMALEKKKRLSISPFKPCPSYNLISESTKFDTLISTLAKELLPTRGFVQKGKAEVYNMEVANLKQYLNHIVAGASMLDGDEKYKIAERVRELKSTSTFRDLFQDDSYEQYSLEQLSNFLEEMEIHEPIERARQIDIAGVFGDQSPIDKELHEKLKLAHEKEIQLSSLMIRPLKNNDDNFQYLNHDATFVPTTTTRVLADLWKLDDTRYDGLIFPQLNTNQLVASVKFPSLNLHKRKQPEEEELFVSFSQPVPIIPMPVVAASSSQPMTKKAKTVPIEISERLTLVSLAAASSSQHVPVASTSFTNISTQPLPGVFGSRTKKSSTTVPKKKKKPKTSGFK